MAKVYDAKFIDETREMIKYYRKHKHNDIFNFFYHSHLNLFEDALKLYEEHYHGQAEKEG